MKLFETINESFEHNEQQMVFENNAEFVFEKLVTLGNKAYPKFGNVVIMAGGAGCYPKGTEFFDGKGWKPIDQYETGDKVLQYNMDGTTELVQPLDYINLPVDKFTRIKNRRVDFVTSETHKHLVINDKTKKLETKLTSELRNKHENLSRGNKVKLVTSFKYGGDGINLSNDEIMLKVAIFADDHFLPRVGEPKCRVSLKKTRKIKRFEDLLKSNNIEYKKYEENGFQRFEFTYNSNEKEFESYWYNASNDQLKVICDEVLLWDGSTVNRDNRKSRLSYCTTSKKSMDFIQFAFASCGIDTKIGTDVRVDRKPCYELTINYTKGVGISKNPRVENTTSMEIVDMGDRMYCFTVPSGFFVVRQSNKIYVSGNSGKGFIISNLLGMEGKTFDVDALKALSLKSTKIADKVKREFGVDLKNMNLRTAKDVGTLHDIIGGALKLPKKAQQATYASILTANPERKPNLLFDVTLKDISKLSSITRDVQQLGYDKKNIHIVWVVNDIEVAIDQNKKRSRVVPQDILLATHRGVALTMNDIATNALDLGEYMDGDIWFVFNKRGVDSTLQFSKKGGMSVKDAETVKIKASGKKIDQSKLTKDVINKIVSYVPKVNSWKHEE
ncbi:hypothetical protein HYO65_gp187 [Tenacibaculum phage PTm1]|uniref:Uncharacterized protein n=2 Tax=Shirahamavirus PTm1 TaxID=2846435 RepID=A0A5S9ERU6_9CAUD|nr:hypothetical protein HYO65_gp187 [Tenacibaculum phage PTm1]BBI90579.1 hypothetical protein [Tenacibaculum phage PTm1]BBI90887.1 hypothetical protein [Tenacibaculum phage PTm5]